MICQFCKGYGEKMYVYAGKYYHFYCWEKLKAVARRTGGVL